MHQRGCGIVEQDGHKIGRNEVECTGRRSRVSHQQNPKALQSVDIGTLHRWQSIHRVPHLSFLGVIGRGQ